MKYYNRVPVMAAFLICSLISRSQTGFAVYFDFDKHQLTPGTLVRLDSFIQAEKDHLSSMLFHLYGHCDIKGSDEYNYSLSQKRVASVKNTW